MATPIPDSAMVLAAGLGLRLRPLTQDRPKALVEVAGRALIDHALDRLAAAGCARAVVNLHYRGRQLRRHIEGAGRSRPEVIFSDESGGLLDTGGGIRAALPLLGPAPFLAINCDSLWADGPRPALARLAEAWDAKTMDAFLLLAPTPAAIGYDGPGDFTMAPDGRLARRREQTVAPFVFTGVQMLDPRLFDGAPAEAFSLNRLYDRALAAGRLFGCVHDGAWMHVGTPQARVLAERCLQPQGAAP